MISESEALIETYVDDPIVVMRGSKAKNRINATLVIMWWLALGLPISWGKGAIDDHTAWIGANLQIIAGRGVRVEIPEKYALTVLELVESLH